VYSAQSVVVVARCRSGTELIAVMRILGLGSWREPPLAAGAAVAIAAATSASGWSPSTRGGRRPRFAPSLPRSTGRPRSALLVEAARHRRLFMDR